VTKQEIFDEIIAPSGMVLAGVVFAWLVWMI